MVARRRVNEPSPQLPNGFFSWLMEITSIFLSLFRHVLPGKKYAFVSYTHTYAHNVSSPPLQRARSQGSRILRGRRGKTLYWRIKDLAPPLEKTQTVLWFGKLNDTSDFRFLFSLLPIDFTGFKRFVSISKTYIYNIRVYYSVDVTTLLGNGIYLYCSENCWFHIENFFVLLHSKQNNDWTKYPTLGRIKPLRHFDPSRGPTVDKKIPNRNEMSLQKEIILK